MARASPPRSPRSHAGSASRPASRPALLPGCGAAGAEEEEEDEPRQTRLPASAGLEESVPPPAHWGPTELRSEMQLQDQRLREKLLQLHAGMQDLKAECAYWERSDPSREPVSTRARSSSEDMGVPAPTDSPTSPLKGETSRRNSVP
ncbi:uncharacterized protein C20orf202 homolog [Alligator mississippiensis]|uniref:uncharacterized protein C20orf202 homolog n=1 Tax=Alligator mississippiensis TaxID=8496 RepID=UPI002877E12D|nr:uncharacterized protein C20orf202 homolog [Alligator mississippiensis]